MKKIYWIVGIFLLMACTINTVISYKTQKKLSDVAIANIRALAQWEIPGLGLLDEYMPQTPPQRSSVKRCTLYFPDGSFTGSVERICIQLLVCLDRTRTPVACGEVFYN